MKKMSLSLIIFSKMMLIPSFLSLFIVPITIVGFLFSDISKGIGLIIAIVITIPFFILLFYFLDTVVDSGYRERVTLNFTEKSKRVQELIDSNTHKSVMSVVNKNHILKVYFIDFEFFVTEFIKNSNKAYDAGKIHELDNQIRESYKTVTNLLLSDGVKSVLNGYAKDFKKDVINVAAALIKKHRDIVYDLALEAQNTLNERNTTNEKNKNSKAEQDAVSIIQNPEYKKLVQEG
jgi:hypothetical protein